MTATYVTSMPPVNWRVGKKNNKKQLLIVYYILDIFFYLLSDGLVKFVTLH